MSSEETGEEELEDGEKWQLLIVKPILWRSLKLTAFCFGLTAVLKNQKVHKLNSKLVKELLEDIQLEPNQPAIHPTFMDLWRHEHVFIHSFVIYLSVQTLLLCL